MKTARINKETATEVIAAMFILLFVYAALSKILDHTEFEEQLIASPMFRPFKAHIGIIALMIPLSEFVISVLLLFRRSRLIGFILSLITMTAFTLYVIWIVNFSPFTPCTCGGVIASLTWTQHLVFNIAFTFLALAGIYISKRPDLRANQIAPV